MFQELAKNTCVGQAFKIWFKPYQDKSEPRDKEYFIGWNYGYNIFGDPMITLVERDAVVEVTERNRIDPIIGNVDCMIKGRTLTFGYTLSTATPVEIDLFTIAGKRVPSLMSVARRGGGSVISNWTAVANGTYIISLKAGSLNDARRLNIVK